MARDIDTHVHRIGRTGRAGEKGTAFTLLTPRDVHFAGSLVRNLVSGLDWTVITVSLISTLSFLYVVKKILYLLHAKKARVKTVNEASYCGTVLFSLFPRRLQGSEFLMS